MSRYFGLDLYSSLSANAYLVFRNTGIDPYAKKLRIENNIIIVNQSDWGEIEPNEVDDFIKSISDTRFPETQPIYITKKPDTPLKELAQAINLTSKWTKSWLSCSPLIVEISSVSDVDVFIPVNGKYIVFGRAFLQKTMGSKSQMSFIKYIAPPNMIDLLQNGLSPLYIKDLSGFTALTIDNLKEASFNKDLAPIWRKLKTWTSHIPQISELAANKTHTYDKRVVDHTVNVIASLNQIPEIYYNPALFSLERQLGFQKLFTPGCSRSSIINNLSFMKSMFLRVKPNIIYPTLLYHDIGKAVKETFHYNESVKLIKEQDLLEYWDINDMEKKIIKSSILFHHVPGGFALGEYSLSIFAEMLNNTDVRTILCDGKFPLFIDNLLLLSSCDIAGYGSVLPLNVRINKYRQLDGILTDFGKMLLSGNLLSKHISITKLLLPRTVKYSPTRLSDFLCSDDKNINVNLKIYGDNFYINKLYGALKEMRVPRKEWKNVEVMFALLRRFEYGSKFMSYILWDNNDERTAISADSQVNRNAIRFLIELSNKLDDGINKGLPIDMTLVRSRDSSIIKREEYNSYIEYFRAQFDRGYSPNINIRYIQSYGRDISIHVEICLPEPKKQP